MNEFTNDERTIIIISYFYTIDCFRSISLCSVDYRTMPSNVTLRFIVTYILPTTRKDYIDNNNDDNDDDGGDDDDENNDR